jgi:hypothetical protein
MANRTYLLPQVIIQQDFKSLPASATQDLIAVIVGPQKSVRTISDPDDLSNVAYGTFASSVTGSSAPVTYTLKGVTSLDVVQRASIYMELREVSAVYATLSGGNVFATTPNTLTIPSGFGYIAYPSLSISRRAEFKNRDVAVGDGVVILNGGVVVGTTTITGFERTTVAATAAAGTADANNQIAATTAATVTASGTTVATHTPAASATAYQPPLELGFVGDTYTVTCVTGGVGGTAKFNVTSLRGDNVSNVTSVALASPMAVGTRGLTLTITGSGNYVVGQIFSIVATRQFTSKVPSVANAASAYTGAVNTVYEVKVVKGGVFADSPQVSVTTTNGVDYAAPQAITTATSEFYLGTLGLKAVFSASPANTGLRLGDVFYIAVTAASLGAALSARISDPLPSTITNTTQIVVHYCYNAASVKLPRVGYPDAGSVAWTISTDNKQVVLDDDIFITNSNFTELNGLLLNMKVAKATVFIGYDALKLEKANQINTISDASLIEAQIGKLVPENPIAYGVFKALENSAGVRVYYVPVDEETVAGYSRAFEATTYDGSAYYITPMTNDPSIIEAAKAHVLASSDDSKSRERIALVNEPFSTTKLKVDKKVDGQGWTGYVFVSPTVASQFDRAIIPDASLLTDGIRPGDYFRSNFSTDALGNETYQSVKIISVLDEENMILEAPAFSSAIGSSTTPRRVQISRVLSKNEQAQEISAASSGLASRRVVNVWPNLLGDGDMLINGYFGAAAIAGLKSGVAPHQPLTNVTLTGFTTASNSTPYFTLDQLNTVAGGGTWIIDQERVGSDSAGMIYNRHQLTTDYTDDNMSEISITTNLDSISKILREDLKVFIGQYNNHPYFTQLLHTRLADRLTYLQGYAVTEKAGPQLIDYEIISVETDPLIRTRVNVNVNLTLPYPVNVINLKLTVV